MSRAAIPQGGDDDIMTPPPLALAITEHFAPSGRILEPARGEGAFINAFEAYSATLDERLVIEWMEIKHGRDFLHDYTPTPFYDWIITNPPWSKIGISKKDDHIGFLRKSIQHARNIVFLIHVNAMFTNSRRQAMRDAGYFIREIAECDRPVQWRSMGLQLAAIHISSDPGDCRISRIEYDNKKDACK